MCFSQPKRRSRFIAVWDALDRLSPPINKNRFLNKNWFLTPFLSPFDKLPYYHSAEVNVIHIKYNTEGKFLPGAFYDLNVPLSIGIYEDVPDQESGAIVSGQVGVEYYRVETIHEDERVRCASQQAHVLEWRTKTVSADVLGGEKMGILIPDITMFHVVMTPDIARQFAQQKFHGADVKPLTINVNQSDLRNPQFSYVEVKAPRCTRDPEVIITGSIACPYCGWKPMVCPACNYWERSCPSCRKDPYVETAKHGGASDIRFKRDRPVAIWEGHRWTGSDFMGRGPIAVSERVVQWLLATHAYPFVARPLQFDITGMTREQIRILKQVAPKAARAL